jgi:predicted metal-dependent hydrolase
MIQRGNRSGVLLKEDVMILTSRVPGNRERVRDILRRWYREQAESVIRDRMPEWRMGLPAHEIRYRWMRSRWGSCSRRGVIVFNTQLVKAPVEYLDFVVAHELLHLLHHNHGVDFRKALDNVMPDWRARRRGLKKLPLML